MGKDKDDKLKESAMHDFANKRKIAQVHQELLEAVNRKTEASLRNRDANSTAGVKNKRKKAEEYKTTVKQMHEGKNTSSNKNMEFGTFFSWVMNSAPEFEAIVKSICYDVHARRKQYLGDPMSRWIVGKGAYGYHYLVESLSSNPDMQLPDIKYITEVDENGKFNLELIQDSFDGLLNNPDGSYDKAAAIEAQQIFQGYVSEWIDSLDGVGPGDQGYFLAKTGNPPVSKLYSKADGEQAATGNAWIIKPGNEEKFVKQEVYESILNGCGVPEKSFSAFLQHKCHDINYERTPTLGM